MSPHESVIFNVRHHRVTDFSRSRMSLIFLRSIRFIYCAAGPGTIGAETFRSPRLSTDQPLGESRWEFPAGAVGLRGGGSLRRVKALASDVANAHALFQRGEGVGRFGINSCAT